MHGPAQGVTFNIDHLTQGYEFQEGKRRAAGPARCWSRWRSRSTLGAAGRGWPCLLCHFTLTRCEVEWHGAQPWRLGAVWPRKPDLANPFPGQWDSTWAVFCFWSVNVCVWGRAEHDGGKKIQLGLWRQTPKRIAQRRLTFMEQKTFFFFIIRLPENPGSEIVVTRS